MIFEGVYGLDNTAVKTILAQFLNSSYELAGTGAGLQKSRKLAKDFLTTKSVLIPQFHAKLKVCAPALFETTDGSGGRVSRRRRGGVGPPADKDGRAGEGANKEGGVPSVVQAGKPVGAAAAVGAVGAAVTGAAGVPGPDAVEAGEGAVQEQKQEENSTGAAGAAGGAGGAGAGAILPAKTGAYKVTVDDAPVHVRVVDGETDAWVVGRTKEEAMANAVEKFGVDATKAKLTQGVGGAGGGGGTGGAGGVGGKGGWKGTGRSRFSFLAFRHRMVVEMQETESMETVAHTGKGGKAGDAVLKLDGEDYFSHFQLQAPSGRSGSSSSSNQPQRARLLARAPTTSTRAAVYGFRAVGTGDETKPGSCHVVLCILSKAGKDHYSTHPSVVTIDVEQLRLGGSTQDMLSHAVVRDFSSYQTGE